MSYSYFPGFFISFKLFISLHGTPRFSCGSVSTCVCTVVRRRRVAAPHGHGRVSEAHRGMRDTVDGRVRDTVDGRVRDTVDVLYFCVLEDYFPLNLRFKSPKRVEMEATGLLSTNPQEKSPL